jgi:hypothetical protein
MPAAAAGAIISGALAYGAGVTVFGLGVLASAIVIGGSQLVLGAISYAMTPKPKTGSQGVTNSAGTTSVRQSDLTRQIVYGHTRITRGYAQIEATDVNDQLHIILILCEGELRAINEVWMSDYAIPNDWIDANGNVTTGRYAGKLVIRKHLGANEQAADSLAVSNIPGWTTSHRLQGTAYLYLILTKDQDIYPNGVPNITAIVEGQEVYDPREGTDVWTTNIALFAHDFIRNDKYGFGAFEDDVDEVNIAAQANICDEIVDTDGETSFIVTSIASNRLRLTADLLPYEFGDRVQITSTGSLPTGITSGVDYYVIPYQIKDAPRFLLASSFENALAKVSISVSGGTGTIRVAKTGEPRYHGCGAVDSEVALTQTLNDLASSMAGRAINVAGFWTLLAGAWRTPVVEYGIGDVRGAGLRVQNSQSMADSYNVVKGTFQSSQNFYQRADYPAAFYEQFIADDNGIEAIKDLPLPFCNRPTTGQRIAKIELFRGRQGIVVVADFSMKGISVKTGDTVFLNVDRYGWEQKPFEVTEFSFTNDEGALLTRMTLRETAQAIYDWSAGEAITFDPAPNTTLTDIFNVMAPQGVSYSSRQIDTQQGDIVYALTLSWAQHADAFVRQYGDFEVQFKLESEPDWRPSFFVDGLLTQTDVVNSSVNIPYDLRIRARNNLGVRSAWVTIFGAVVGSGGGVDTTEDWGSVASTPDTTEDWGSVASTPDTTEDWGFVA